MSLSPHERDDAFQTTYRRDYVYRHIDITAMPLSMKSSSTSPRKAKKSRQRGKRPGVDGLSDSFVLPGRSLLVGPALPSNINAHARSENEDHVSQTLQIEMGDHDPSSDYNKWLISKLPEIVEKCCRRQETPPQVMEILQPPVRRKIRINVSSNPQKGADVETEVSPQGTSPRQRGRSSPRGKATSSPHQAATSNPRLKDVEEQYLFDPGSGLRQVQQVRRSRTRFRQRERRPASTDATSHDDLRADNLLGTSSRWDAPPSPPLPRDRAEPQATAELVRRVLEEMFGPRLTPGGKADAATSTVAPMPSNSTTACQTSQSLTDVTSLDPGPQTDTSVPQLATERPAIQRRRRSPPSPARRLSLERRKSPRRVKSPARHTSPLQPERSARRVSPTRTLSPEKPLSAGKCPGSTPSTPPSTSREILETLTESNRLLSEMTEFFRRAELSDKITQRTDVEMMEAELQEAERRYLQLKGADRGDAGELTSPHRRGNFASAPNSAEGRHPLPTSRPGSASQQSHRKETPVTPSIDGSTQLREPGTPRQSGEEAMAQVRQAADTVFGDRIRQSSSAPHCSSRSPPVRTGSDGALGRRPAQMAPLSVAQSSVTARSWERQRRMTTTSSQSAGPRDSTSPTSSSRSQWDATLHSAERPYRSLPSPPAAGAGSPSPRLSWPSSPAGDRAQPSEELLQPCSHRGEVDVDSTTVLLNYDPWTAIENDFKSLLD